MRRIGTILAAAAAMAARAIGLKSAEVSPPSPVQSGTDPVKRNARQPARLPGWATLVWDSGRLGPAYRLHDAQGRKIYVPLKSVPPDKRVPRRVRMMHEQAERRGSVRANRRWLPPDMSAAAERARAAAAAQAATA